MNEEGKVEIKQITDGTYSASGTLDNISIIKGTLEDLLVNRLEIKVNTNSTSRSILITVEVEGVPTSFSYQITGPNNYSMESKNETTNTHTFDKLNADTEYTIKVTVKNKAGLIKETTKTLKTQKIENITLDLTPKDAYIKSGTVLIKYPSVIEGQVNQYKWCTFTEEENDECESKTFTNATENPISIPAQNGILIARILKTASSDEALTTGTKTIHNIDNIPPEITLLSTQKTTNSIIIPYSIEEAHIGEVTCKYSDKENTYTSNGTVGENSCSLTNGITKGKTYYYQICVTDLAGNGPVCKEGSELIKEIPEPTFDITHTPSNASLSTTNGYSYEEVVSISFTNTGLTNPKYYVKTTDVGTSNINVTESCGSEIEPGECTSVTSTTTLTANTWYKVNGNLNITYSNETETPITVYAVTYDDKEYSTSTTGTTFKIDRNEPTVSFVTNGNSSYAKTQSSVVNIIENKSGINELKYKWTTNNEEDASDGTAFNNEDTLTTPNNLTGTYYLCVYASDLVGNEGTTCSNAYKLDNEGPTITKITKNGLTITIQANDILSNLHATPYSCDGGTTWKASNVCTFEDYGTYEIKVRDAFENPTSKEIRISTDNANAPVLGSLTPVKYENNNWVVADENSDWYNYSNQEWANAVLLKENITKEVGDIVSVTGSNPEAVAMFVWIPRYEYKIEGQYGTHPDGTAGTASLPGEIEVNFISKDEVYEGTNSEGYRIHPAFTFGDDELEGIWVGKFETSHTSLSTSTTENNLGCSNTSCTNADGLRILPGVASLRYNNVSNFFYAAQSMDNRRNIDGDLHMMKNSEWGAAAYLSQSKYGKYGNPNYEGAEKQVRINNCSNYITGVGANSQDEAKSTVTCNTNTNGYTTENGQAASTTGNITGIYDMSGGAYEYVMGVYKKTTGSSGLTVTSIDAKYYDNYTSTTATTACKDENEVSGICYGHALSETSGWYGDSVDFVSSTNPWLARGGREQRRSFGGVFSIDPYDGRAYSDTGIRVVLSQTT